MRFIAGTVLAMVVVAAPASAKPKHRHDSSICYVAPRDVRVVREYYEPRYRALPPGLAKKYARTGRLPPGWAKRIEPLPVEVERRLPPLPREYRRGYIDGSLIVYVPPTQVVIEVVPLFAR
jgi:hypothetical protein